MRAQALDRDYTNIALGQMVIKFGRLASLGFLLHFRYGPSRTFFGPDVQATVLDGLFGASHCGIDYFMLRLMEKRRKHELYDLE